VSVVEKMVSQNKDYEPTPEEQLALGRCYDMLGKKAKAKEWLRRAAKHPETKVRAEQALGELGGD
jgi:lipopolysaccharide biosynthesis regulator YciM